MINSPKDADDKVTRSDLGLRCVRRLACAGTLPIGLSTAIRKRPLFVCNSQSSADYRAFRAVALVPRFSCLGLPSNLHATP